MSKQAIIKVVSVIVVIAAVGFGLSRYLPGLNRNLPSPSPTESFNQSLSATPVSETPTSSNSQQFSAPISRALERVTKKPFGIYITPQNSPVQPERFSGYHTGVDFETFTDEQNIDVPIYAVCDGKLLTKRMATGYGGIAVQACKLENQDVTIIYGHLRLASISANIGDQLKTGDKLAVLGTGFSQEIDGERKHLHLGVHKGTAINILGYVQNSSDLSNWIDITKYLTAQ
jgi:murein DD-endopeptidase MepM/ murein hydrolase activator NlpD